jgi:hypothetical protein
MKTITTILVSLLLLAGLASAQGLSGTFKGEAKMRAQGGEERSVPLTLELKAEGATLTGKVIQAGRPDAEPRPVDIQNGKIEGNKFTFVTVQTTQRGEMKNIWTGTLEGDEIKGTRAREGAQEGRGGATFTAKRAN